MDPYSFSQQERDEKLSQIVSEIEVLRKKSFQYQTGSRAWLENDHEMSKKAAEIAYYQKHVDVSWPEIIKHMPIRVYDYYKGEPYVSYSAKHAIVLVKKHIRKGVEYTGFYCNCVHISHTGKQTRNKVAFIETSLLSNRTWPVLWEDAKIHHLLPNGRTLEETIQRVEHSYQSKLKERTEEIQVHIDACKDADEETIQQHYNALLPKKAYADEFIEKIAELRGEAR
jgi:hypothetical protein